MSLVEKVSQSLMDKIYDETLITNSALMHSTLKLHGQQLETIYKGVYLYAYYTITKLINVSKITQYLCLSTHLYYLTRGNPMHALHANSSQLGLRPRDPPPPSPTTTLSPSKTLN